MNLREGTRRLALLLGVVGAIGGGFVSYLELQDVLNQRVRHNRFEQLASSDVVQQERKILRAWTPVDISAGLVPKSVPPKFDPTQPYSDLPPGAVVLHDPKAPITFNLKDAKPNVNYDALAEQARNSTPAPAGDDWFAANAPKTQPIQSQDPYAAIAKPILDMSKSIPLSSEVNNGGIKTINWDHDYEVASIETDDSQTLYPTTAPSAWNYLLIVLCPILGFLIPWGVVRAIGWVGTGFAEESN